MNNSTNIANEELVSRLEKISAKEKEMTLLVVYYLAEMIRRRLYAELGYSSVFEYVVQGLGYSNASAMRRTKAAKVVAIFPEVYQVLVAGKISMSVLEVVADAIPSGHAKDLLEKVEGKTREEAIQIAAGYFPMKPAFIIDRIKPVFVEKPAVAKFTAKCDEQLQIPEKTTCVRSEVNTNSIENELMFCIKFYAKPSLNSKIKRAKELLFAAEGNADLETVFERALDDFLDKHCPNKREERREQRREKKLEKVPEKEQSSKEQNKVVDPVKGANQPSLAADNERFASVALKDRVLKRDQHQCTYVAPDGMRCSAKCDLEIDHVVPWARGGKTEAENLRVVCRAHNQMLARRVFGDGYIESVLRSGPN